MYIQFIIILMLKYFFVFFFNRLTCITPSLSASVTSLTRDLRDFSAAGLIRDFSFRTQVDIGKYTSHEISRITW